MEGDRADGDIRAAAGGPRPAWGLCFCLVITRESGVEAAASIWEEPAAATCGVVVVFVLKVEGLAKEENGERKIRSHRPQASAVTRPPARAAPDPGSLPRTSRSTPPISPLARKGYKAAFISILTWKVES